jgi:hypothetical protein
MCRIIRLAADLAAQNKKLAAVLGEEIRCTWWDWNSFKVNDDVQTYLYRARVFGKALPEDDDRGRHRELEGKAEFAKMMEAAAVANDGLKASRSLKETKAYWRENVAPILGELAQAYCYHNDLGVTMANAATPPDTLASTTARDLDRTAKFQALYGKD